MPRFYVNYISRSGRRHKVKLDAINQAILTDEIEIARRAYIVEIRKVGSGRLARDRMRVPSRMLITALDSLELMLVSGVRINSAIRTLAESAPSCGTRKLWTELVLLIEETGSFGGSISNFPRIFDESMVGIIVAYEAAGRLCEGVVAMRGYMAQMQEIKRESTLGATYPILVCTVGTAVFGILCEFTLPRFSKMLADIGVKKTNRITESFFTLSDMIVHHPAYVMAILCLPMALIYCGLSQRIRPYMDRLMLRLPVLRTAVEALVMARVCVTMRALSESGIRIVEALESCAVVAGNAVYSDGIHEVIAAVKENISVGAGFERARIFAPEVVMAVKSGEASLSDVFGRLADYYSTESRHRVAMAMRLAEPVMLILVLAWVFAVTLAVILPVVGILDGIH